MVELVDQVEVVELVKLVKLMELLIKNYGVTGRSWYNWSTMVDP